MEVVKDESQIGGCMAGFFNIFDRPHLLSPKRLSLKSASPPVGSGEKQQSVSSSSSDEKNLRSVKQASPWRFSREAPRLSLDSRAVVDAKGTLKHRQIQEGSGSPSVVARLMGLDAFPTLQRSASESRVTRDYGLVDFQNPSKAGGEDPADCHIRARAPQRRKSFFDPTDFFPEARQCGPAPTADLETLVEALRLKGLLRSSANRNHFGIRSGTPAEEVSPCPRRSTSVKSRPTLKERQQRSHSSWRRPEPVKTRNRGGSIIQDECELWKVHESNRQGKTLLERCDKLLHSIAEMAAAPGESQPSPVSVLDASLYHEESSPSPVMKRSLDFTAGESEEDESWGVSMMSSSSDSEYVYVSDILRASDCLPQQESDIFSLLEKQQYLKGRDAAQERRLIFDAVQEIVGRIRSLPPWRMVGEADMMHVIWSEFQKQRASSTEEKDPVGYVCGRDVSEDRWRDCQVEMSEAVLDVERLVFKDLIGETIRHLAALKSSHSLPRRLLF